MFTRSLSLRHTAPVRHGALNHLTRRSLANVVDVDNPPAEDDKPFRVPISENSFETYEFEPPPYSLETTKGQLKQLYRDMLTIRRMEMTADRLYKEKKIRGFCHLSTGQEGVAVGIEHGITKDDKLITAYRSHGFTYVRGASVKSIIGELLGRQQGISYGKGGSMHMFLRNFFGGNGIVGASVPVGTGIGFTQAYNDTKNVVINLYGDGAANQGQVHESFNMAKLWNLPVMFGCENNQYGMGTSAERASAMTDYYKRGQYIPGLRVNGMDVLAVIAAVKHGCDYVRAGNGPLVYEYVTYRYAGHSMSDPGVIYRSREELQQKRKDDPITKLKEKLLDWKVYTEDEAKDIEREIRTEVNKEADEAERMTDPPATPTTLFQDVYVRGSEPLWMRGRTTDETYYYR